MSEEKRLEIYGQLTADFPKFAYSEDKTRGFALTSLRAQYVKERLNEVFGIDGWKITGEYEKTEDGVIYHGTLIIRMPGTMYLDKDGNIEKTVDGRVHEIESVGYSLFKQKKRDGTIETKLLGDVYKSAQTDALSKCASFIGIGNEMFKGNIKVGGSKTEKPQYEKPTKKYEPKKESKSTPDVKVEDGAKKDYTSSDIPW